MKPRAHPRFAEVSVLVQKAAGLASSWSGVAYRSVEPGKADPVEILSGQGSFHNGGRWNAPGSFRAVYASLSPELATNETMAYFRYYGFADHEAMPRLMVAIEFKLSRVLDLTARAVRRKLKVTLSEIKAEDWRKLQDRGLESLTQALGRAAFADGLEGLIVPSSRVRGGVNVVYLPDNKRRGSAARVRK
jgi:RES domain-containing protein